MHSALPSQRTANSTNSELISSTFMHFAQRQGALGPVRNLSFLEVASALAEPYLPHPIVGMHVRQGDKVTEDTMWSMDYHMFLALRLRRHVPGITNIWLSSETQVGHELCVTGQSCSTVYADMVWHRLVIFSSYSNVAISVHKRLGFTVHVRWFCGYVH